MCLCFRLHDDSIALQHLLNRCMYVYLLCIPSVRKMRLLSCVFWMFEAVFCSVWHLAMFDAFSSGRTDNYDALQPDYILVDSMKGGSGVALDWAALQVRSVLPVFNL